MNRIDVHGHFLPGVDDGCRDVADAIACARMLVDAGYSHAFCTPHIWPSLPTNTVESIPGAVANLQRYLDDAGISLQLLPGAEYNLDAMWPRLRSLPREQIVTYGLNGRYVLFDFWAGSMRDCRRSIHDGVAHLQSMGFMPILAHPERVEALQREPAEIDRLIEMGVKLQLNSWCLAEPMDSPLFQTATRLMREQKYFLMGTDCHNSHTLRPRLRGVEIAVELFGESVVEKLTVTNPGLLMKKHRP